MHTSTKIAVGATYMECCEFDHLSCKSWKHGSVGQDYTGHESTA
jgi:hypothetical protein